MKTSELHTLKSILTEGIKIEGQDEPVKVSCIYIPKIQRAYAQGRNKESDIRNDFLETLFSVLTPEQEKSIELSFLFGSKQFVAKKSSDGFELLDGQQRATTLFLLYWYVSMKEKGCVQEFLSKFTYETRDTSTQFLSHITAGDFKISINENMPSTAIKNNKWFTDDYYCDPTVCAMLTMLDSIDEMYRKHNCNNIFDKLERLKFYVLMLEKFDMNDELYIKMNSRGLSLVPFENFKASIVRYMKSGERNGLYGVEEVENGNPPFWFTFISNMDAKWIDIFWRYNRSDEEKERECKNVIEMDDRLIGTRYFNFINRYLFTKAALVDSLFNAKIGPLTSFFYNDAESEKMKERLYGWENYVWLFQQNESEIRNTLFYRLQRVFDAFHDYGKDIEESIKRDPFARTNRFEIVADKFNNLHERVVFAAVTEFIENMPDGATLAQENIRTNFERMLRVVFNIIENTLIETPEAAVRVIKAFSELNSANGAITDNFYKSLSTTEFRSDNVQLKEEILKAKEMFSSEGAFIPDWERAFKNAEHHPFFKGSILFFFTEKSGDSEAFTGRYNVVKNLFDENGITMEYREGHILFRALLSQFNSWGSLNGRYITEDAETQKYLKNGIIRQPEIRKMFRGYFGWGDNKKPIKEYLREVVVNAAPQEGESLGFKLLFNRLITDSTSVPLLDWVHESEIKKSAPNNRFKIQGNRSSLVINIPGAWYDRIILDTERHLIIPSLVGKYSMNYDDTNQGKMFEGPVKDSYGWDISIKKEVKGKSETFILKLTFQEWKWVDFYIYGQDTDLLAEKFNVPIEKKHEDFVQVTSVEYRLREDIQPIEKEIDRIISKLQEL